MAHPVPPFARSLPHALAGRVRATAALPSRPGRTTVLVPVVGLFGGEHNSC